MAASPATWGVAYEVPLRAVVPPPAPYAHCELGFSEESWKTRFEMEVDSGRCDTADRDSYFGDCNRVKRQGLLVVLDVRTYRDSNARCPNIYEMASLGEGRFFAIIVHSAYHNDVIKVFSGQRWPSIDIVVLSLNVRLDQTISSRSGRWGGNLTAPFPERIIRTAPLSTRLLTARNSKSVNAGEDPLVPHEMVTTGNLV